MAYTNEQLGKALEDLTTAYNNFIEKAKEAAIAAMGDTVIAQIKQEAKDHISAELAAQKTALEQAIENAKIAINNSSTQAHTTLQQAAATASGELTATAEAKKLELSALIQTAEEALQGKVNEAKSYIESQLSLASAEIKDVISSKIEEKIQIVNENVNNKITQQFLEKTSNAIPLPTPTEAGAAGLAGVMETLSRSDHQHPSEIETYLFKENFFYLKFRNGFLIQGLKIPELVSDRYSEKILPQAYASFNYATAVGQWNADGLVGSVNVELSLSKIRFKSTVSSINAWFLIFGI